MYYHIQMNVDITASINLYHIFTLKYIFVPPSPLPLPAILYLWKYTQYSPLYKGPLSDQYLGKYRK